MRALVRDAWSSKATINAGDEIKLTIMSLRSGTPSDAWTANKIKYQDGRPIAVGHELRCLLVD